MKTIVEQTKGFFKVLRFSFGLALKSSRRYFLCLVCFNFIAVILPFVQIFIVSQTILVLVESLGTNEHMYLFQQFIFYSIAFLLVAILERAIQQLHTHCEGLYREILHKHIQFLVIQKSAELDLAFFDLANYYDELRDTSANSVFIIDTTFHSIDFIKYLVQLLIAVWLLAQMSIIYALLLMVSIIPNVIFKNRQMSALYRMQRKNYNEERKMYYISGLLSSREYAKDVRLYNLLPFVSRKYDIAWKMLYDKKSGLSRRHTVMLILASSLPEIINALLFFQMGYGVIRKSINMGDYSYYQGIAGQLLTSMYNFVFNFSRLADGNARITNFLKFLDIKNDVIDHKEYALDPSCFHLEFRDVWFRYESGLPYVLKGASFTYVYPQKMALVGNNGCGKTTIIKLLLRFYDPDRGCILLNGKDIRGYALKELRGCYSAMFQNFCNCALTVRDSISLSQYEHVTDQAVDYALQKSGAKPMVDDFEHGLDTYLTRQYAEQGVELSGGQWQKIALGRTFYKTAKVFILDEPSAALDAESEDKLLNRFNEL